MWGRLGVFLRRCQVAGSLSLIFCLLSQSLHSLADSATLVGDRVIDAINCGGPGHTDVFGIRYREDNLGVGTPSDHGKRFLIGRVAQQDQILYQTERYHIDDFAYHFKVIDEGDYVLVLKFSEVYFTAPGQKVFDVSVNGVPVLGDLDIFGRVGKAIAHDEYIPFSIKNGALTIAGTSVDFTRKLHVNFLKGTADNPKVNALYVMKGSLEALPELAKEELEEEEEEETESKKPIPERPDASGRLAGETEEEAAARRAKLASGPKTPDPYSTQDQSQMLIPILVVVLAFFPVLFCLCKL